MDTTTTILVIDDEEGARRALRRAIVAAGARFRWAGEAADALEGLSLWRSLRPDLVLIGHTLPQTDGLTVARAIRDREPDQAIVLCAGTVTAELVRRARGTGVHTCLARSELHRLPEVLEDLPPRRADGLA